MVETTVVGLAHLSDVELLAQLTRCAGRARGALVDLLRHLAEVDRRRLYLGQGCASLFTYVVEVLHLSENEAAKRIQAARLGARLPEVLERMASGELHLSGAVLMAPHLDGANVSVRLAAATHKTKRQIEELVAGWAPRPDAVARLAKLPGSVAQPARAAVGGLFDAPRPFVVGGSEIAQSVGNPVGDCAPGFMRASPMAPDPTAADPIARVSTAPRGSVGPLSPDRYRLQVTLSGKGHAALQKARALTKHKNPSGDLSVLIEEALAMLADHLERRRFGKRKVRLAGARKATGRSPESEAVSVAVTEATAGNMSDDTAAVVPEAAESVVSEDQSVVSEDQSVVSEDCSVVSEGQQVPEPVAKARSRYLPAFIRRSVAERDGGRCAFESPEGRRCSAKFGLEFHHAVPFGRGGEHSIENISLRCRAHNVYSAERDFGRELLESRIAQRRNLAKEPTHAR